MRALYHAADALVMPSLYEGMPNAVLEASACGIPCIVSHAANRDRIVLDGLSGYEVPTFSHGALADAIQKVVHASDAERRAMGARGRAHVSETFHPDRILDETVALYDSLLAEKGIAIAEPEELLAAKAR
jgi:glycosyltransferase involved in cell wall biosynthesis